MKKLLAILTAALIFLCTFSASWAEGGFDLESRQAMNSEDTQNKINVTVDPRIELILIIQRLSNANNKYKTREYEFLYKNEINTYFENFRNLDAVEMFNEYSLKYPNFFTGIPQAVLYLTAPPDLEEQFPVPSSLLASVGGKQVFEEFIRALRNFALETKFMDFYNNHQLMYAQMVDGVYQKVPDVKQIGNTVEKYFGDKQRSYTIILSPIAFAAGFWPSVTRPDGSKDLYYVMQPTGIEEGIPVYYSGGGAEDLVTQAIQGFSYSFVTPVVSKYSYDMSRTVSLFEGTGMSGYFNSWNNAVIEQIVRAIAIKLGHKDDGNVIIKSLLYKNYEAGFNQILDIAARLDEYESQKSKYSTFQDFFPRIVNLFEEKGGNPGALSMEIGGTLSVKGISAETLAGKGYRLRVLMLEDKELTKLTSTRTFDVTYLPFKWRTIVPKKEHFYVMFFIDVNNNMKKEENEPFTSAEVKSPGGKSNLSINAALDFTKINLQSLTGYPSSNQVIKFSDPGLEAAVRSVLKKPYGNLMGSDVLRVTGLTAQNKNISTLEGLQYLKNLSYLDLQTNKITDLTPVKDLVKLESLYVGYNSIKDISPIKDLTYLKNLQISNNFIDDIGALENLARLEYINISNNTISDISPMTNLTKLKSVGMVSNKIADIEPLRGMVNMTSLQIQGNQIENIDALRNMDQLDYLNLGSNKINDINVLSDMTKLKTLYLKGNPINNYSPVSGYFEQLVNKDFSLSVAPAEQEIVFPDPVLEKAIRTILRKPEGSLYPKDAQRLTKITVQAKGITSIEGLQFCKNLQTLDLSTNQIEDLSPLKDLKKLESLYIGWNKIRDISPLKDLIYLRNLQFTMNEVEDINALANMTRLEYLAFGSNIVSDISPLKDMVLLNKLGFVHNKITDIEPIRGLTKITNLQVQGNQFSDISPLSDMVDMDYLNIGFNNISDISPLKNMTKLKTLMLRNNPILDFTPVAGIYDQLQNKDFKIEGR